MRPPAPSVTGGRTVWWGKDSAWWRREWIVELGEEFGATGPAIIDWLSCEAKAQNDGGLVKTGHKTIARGCFVDLVTVGHVLSRSVTVGLLEEFTEDRGRFSCRISGWQSDQERASGAARKAKERSRNTEDPPFLSRSVTVSHGQSRNVTLTGQDRTEEQQTSSLRSDVVEQQLDQTKQKLQNEEFQQAFDYWRDQCGHEKAKPTPGRRRRFAARRKEGYTLDEILRGIDGAAQNPPRNDETGVVYDDLVSICRTGDQLERYIARANPKSNGRSADTPSALSARIQARGTDS